MPDIKVTLDVTNGHQAAVAAVAELPDDLTGQTVTVDAAKAVTVAPSYAEEIVRGVLVDRRAAHLAITDMQIQPQAVFQLAGERYAVMDRMRGTVASQSNVLTP